MVALDEAFVRGVLVAGAVLDDTALARAKAALAPPLRDVLLPRAAMLAESGGAERAEALRGFASALRPAPRADADLSPRARAAVAALAPRDVAAAWLASAPRPRRGFAPSAGLRRAVMRGAMAPTRAASGEVAAKERGKGREAVALALRGLAENARSALLAELDAEEASAVLALAPLLAPGTPSPPPRLVDAARATRGTLSLTRVLGALLLGAAGELGGDASSVAARRAGREIAELDEEVAAWRA